MKITKLTIIPLFIFLASCGGGKSDEIMGRDFKSIKSCVDSMKKVSSGSLNIVTDKSSKVSGALSNGKTFNCVVKQSGTKGTYVEGWYHREKR